MLFKPIVCKRGVTPAVVDGRDTFLEESEIVPLEEIDTEILGIPAGEQQVTLGIQVDPGKNLDLLVRPTSFPDVEPHKIRLSLNPRTGQTRLRMCDGMHVTLLLDCSGSMAGEKLKLLKQGANRFIDHAIERTASVSVVSFGGGAGAQLACPHTTDTKQLHKAVNALRADGGTPMAAALSLAREDFQSIESAIDKFTFLFTDGHPASTSGTARAASEVKQLSRLITIGIGDDVNKPFLIGIASSPEDYHPAKVPENILTVFGNLQTLYLAGEGTQQSDQGQ